MKEPNYYYSIIQVNLFGEVQSIPYIKKNNTYERIHWESILGYDPFQKDLENSLKYKSFDLEKLRRMNLIFFNEEDCKKCFQYLLKLIKQEKIKQNIL